MGCRGRPVAHGMPLVATHEGQTHCLTLEQLLLTLELRIKPPEPFTYCINEQTRFTMVARENRQAGCPLCSEQVGIVGQLLCEEDIVPSGNEVYRCVHPRESAVLIDLAPVGLFRSGFAE